MKNFMELLKDLKDDDKRDEKITKYMNDYPMGELLTGCEFDFALSLIQDEDFITTKNGYKVGFTKGRSFVYFIYYKEIPPFFERPVVTNEDFLIYMCNSLLLIINVPEFEKKILHFLKNFNDDISYEDLNTLICNYLDLVYGSVEIYLKKNEEITEWYEERIRKESGE